MRFACKILAAFWILINAALWLAPAPWGFVLFGLVPVTVIWIVIRLHRAPDYEILPPL